MDCSRENSTTARLPVVKCVELRDDTAMHVSAGQLTLPQSREAVLDYIVERKRMDDLASSITDGRFREQKVY